MTKTELQNWFIENETELMLKMTETFHGFHGIEDNPFHLEGSVWTHTKMVMDVCEKYFSQNSNYEELLFISLLHDLGKTCTILDTFGDPNSTTELGKKNRRSFRNHESVSMFMAKDILNKFPAPLMSNVILKTIANHGSLYNYLKDGEFTKQGKEHISKMYSRSDLQIMRDFYICDHLGRIQEKNDKDIQKVIDGFNEIIESISGDNQTICFDKRLTILVGLPRSGKSTYAQKFFNSEVDIISRDAFVETLGKGADYSEKWKSLTEDEQKNIDKLLNESFQRAIKKDKDIIIDMTNMSKKSRRKWLGRETKGYTKQAIVFIESKETCLSRNTVEKFIPESVLDNMMRSFVFPDYEEFDSVIIC